MKKKKTKIRTCI